MEEGTVTEDILNHGTLIENIIGVGNLLTAPRLAHIWFTLHIEENIKREVESTDFLEEGGLTVQELVNHTDVPQTTLYEDLKDLESFGAITVESDDQPRTYSATFLEVLAENPMLTQDESVFVTPALIGAIGYGYVDENVEIFLNRHGYGAFYLGMEIYQSIARGDTAEENVSDLLPEVSESDLAMIKPALAHSLSELTRDPSHGAEYDV